MRSLGFASEYNRGGREAQGEARTTVDQAAIRGLATAGTFKSRSRSFPPVIRGRSYTLPVHWEGLPIGLYIRYHQAALVDLEDRYV